MILRLLALAVMLATVPTTGLPATDTSARTLCTAGEHVVFSCEIARKCKHAAGSQRYSPFECADDTGHRIASVCRDRSDRAKVVYRFGARDRAELEYPQGSLPARNLFRFVSEDVSFRSHSEFVFTLSFASGRVVYEVTQKVHSDTADGRDDNTAMVLVREPPVREGKALARFECAPGFTVRWDLLTGAVPREESRK